MPWKAMTEMDTRSEFVKRAREEGANKRSLCREYCVTPRTGYKWLDRYEQEGLAALADRSRQPHDSPNRTPPEVEQLVVQARQRHPAWGGRKLRAYLEREGHPALPSPSTITAILHRHGLIDPQESQKHTAFQRFAMEQPNQLWQMDFKGCFSLSPGGYCHPLTVLDDHSRFLLGLFACPDQRHLTVQDRVTAVFRHYGLPERMLMDNGPPWGDDRHTPNTVFTIWLIRLGIQVSHGRPYHPQTQGKDERLHRTLQEELLSRTALANLEACQQAFDGWRNLYNLERPHEALDQRPPATRYHPSSRPFPETLPPILYPPGDIICKVDATGRIYFHNRKIRVGKALRHNPVGIRPTDTDGLFDIYFCSQRVVQIDLRHVPS